MIHGQLGTFDGIAVHQSNLVPFGHLYRDRHGSRDILIAPRTRPTLVLPLTEQVALREGIRPWYWDVATWPFRQPISAMEYLRWFGLTRTRRLP